VSEDEISKLKIEISEDEGAGARSSIIVKKESDRDEGWKDGRSRSLNWE